MNKYQNVSDEELLRRLREGESAIADFLMDKYKELVKKKAKAMYLLGGESDDLIQEGMIGLFKAVRDYDINQVTSFYHFAELCISRQMYTAIKLSQRQKHIPLNSYVSLYDREGGGNGAEEKQPFLIEQLRNAKDNNPEELFLDKEFLQNMERELKEQLSELESRVLHLYLMGEDYRSIALLLGKSPKAIDNALQRIRQKMRMILQ